MPRTPLPPSRIRPAILGLALAGAACAPAVSPAPVAAAPRNSCLADPAAAAARGVDDAPAVASRASFDAAWRMIRDRHWDTTYNGVDWRAVREELGPRADSARTMEESRAAIRAMLQRLGQSHFALIPREDAAKLAAAPSRGEAAAAVPADSTRRSAALVAKAAPDADADAEGAGSAGIELRHTREGMLVTRVDSAGAASLAGVRPGWIVTQVGRCRMSDLVALVPADAPAGQRVFRATAYAQAMFAGDAGDTIPAVFLGPRSRRTVRRLVLQPERGTSVTFGNLPTFHARLARSRLRDASGLEVGVIRFNVWMPVLSPALDSAIDALRDADGLVIDLRGNPGGVGAMVMGLAGHLSPTPVSLGTMKTRANEMRFVTNPRTVSTKGTRVATFAGPVAILVDRMSGSTSEMFAGGLQAIGRARVFGDTTAGAVLPALNERLPSGDVLYHAFADYVTPKGERLEGRGVLPDSVLPYDRRALLAGHDRALEAAVAWIAGRGGVSHGR